MNTQYSFTSQSTGGYWGTCSHCGGSGYIDVECNPCGGTGHRFDQTKCPHCNGLGQKAIKCSMCDGKGKVWIPET